MLAPEATADTQEISMTDVESQVLGPLFNLPEDLYVPAGGLEIITQVFEGPLDLVLYLVRRNKFDILDLPIAEIAEQYARFIELMETIQIELAGEYLAMAATLAKIKSRMLLPAKQDGEDDEDELDPRLELAQRLQEYERIKRLSEWLDVRPRVGRDVFLVQCEGPERSSKDDMPVLELVQLAAAFKNVLALAAREQSMILGRETLSVKERVASILNALRKSGGNLRFQDLFDAKEGRAGMVVAMLALLELVNTNVAYATQVASDSQIHVKLTK